jgi:PAS domain S-box-containing protein
MFETHQLQHAAIVCDAQKRILSWGEEMERMFGLAPIECIGRPIIEVFPEIKATGEYKMLSAAIAGKSDLSIRAARDNPQTRRAISYQAVFTHVAGVGAIIVNTDLQAQHQHEVELQTARARFFALAETNPSLVWSSTIDGSRNFFCSKWLRFTGRTFDQEHGFGWIDNVHPDVADKLRKQLYKAIEAGQNYRIQYRLKSADGTYHSMLETALAQYASDGTFVGFLGYCTDRSEARLTKTRIAPVPTETNRLFKAGPTNAHSPIGMWKLDKELIVTNANKAACDQIGLEHSTLIGTHITEILGSMSETALRELLHGSKRFHSKAQQVRLRKAAGGVAYWDVDAWPLTDPAKNVIGIALSTLEVTERKRVEQQKDDFVATLVHDLKTPLIGADRTLQELIRWGGESENDQARILKLLQASNRHLLTMVQTLIEVYRFEEGNPQLALEPLSLTEIVERAVQDVKALAADKEVQLSFSLSSGGQVAADRIAIRRVLQNLLDNAIKFTDKNGTVQVTSEIQDSVVLVHVKDTGRGIPIEDQPRIFQKFCQSGDGRKHSTGSGLGLYPTAPYLRLHCRCAASPHNRSGRLRHKTAAPSF